MVIGRGIGRDVNVTRTRSRRLILTKAVPAGCTSQRRMIMQEREGGGGFRVVICLEGTDARC